MAFDGTPTTWIASYAADATNMTIPIASLPELTDAEAHATTGDIREIAWAITEKLFQEFNGRVLDDRPVRMGITKSASINSTTGVLINSIVFTFQTAIGSQNIIDE